MMKFYELKSFYIVTDIKEHKQNKEKILSLIDKLPKSTLDNISKTDWNLPRETKREYLDFFYEMIRPYMDEMIKKLKCVNWDILNGWYQSYGKKDNHHWHLHEKTNYTNVYYLNLPENGIKTQLYNIMEDKIMDEIQVDEGQLLTFPAHIIHRSPVNTSDKIKTIISFNSNFLDVEVNK